MTSTWIYSIYPLIAAVCCALLCFKAFRSGAHSAYLKLFGSFALLNFFQFLCYAIILEHFTIASYLADTYLIVIYFLFTNFLLLALYLKNEASVKWQNYLYIPPVLLTVLHLMGFLIIDYRLENNTILHNDGKYSFAFDLFVLLSTTLTIVTFVVNAYKIKGNSLLASRNIIAAISFIPFIIAISILVILSNTEYVIPVVIVVPTLSLYIVSVFYYISRSRIVDLSVGPRAFFQRLKVASLLLSTLKTKKELDDFNRQLQLLRYKEALQKHNNNYSAAAEELKVHSTTLRNALNNAK